MAESGKSDINGPANGRGRKTASWPGDSPPSSDEDKRKTRKGQKSKKGRTLYCSFCGKSEHEVFKLIAGPSTFICDECVELCDDIIEEENGTSKLTRTIRFEPEHAQAGISILANFARVVAQRYPDIPVEVSIEQRGVDVCLIVVTPSGEMHKVQQTLDSYGEVVRGEMAISDFLPNPLEAQELKSKLDLAALELRMTKELHETVSLQQENRIQTLEAQVTSLNCLVGTAMSASKELRTITMLLAKAGKSNSHIEKAVASLLQELFKPNEGKHSQAVESALIEIKRADEGLFAEIKDIAKKTAVNVSSSSTSGWLATLLGSLPK